MNLAWWRSIAAVQLKSGDVIVLCSDGLYRLLSRQEMIDVLQETAEDMNLAAFKLTAAATDKKFQRARQYLCDFNKNQVVRRENNEPDQM